MAFQKVEMNFLLSNDDGYASPRLHILKECLEAYGTVYVSAPSTERSGASVSLTIGKDITFHQVDERTITVDGSPGDASYVGLSHFRDVSFDIVVSGINKGHNCGKDILFSGTIGSAVIGAIHGHRALSLSSEDTDMEELRKKTEFILSYLFHSTLFETCSFLNVNYPYGDASVSTRVELGIPYNTPFDEYLKRTGECTYTTGIRTYVEDGMEDSDRYRVNHGSFSITPLFPSLFDKEGYRAIGRKIASLK